MWTFLRHQKGNDPNNGRTAGLRFDSTPILHNKLYGGLFRHQYNNNKKLASALAIYLCTILLQSQMHFNYKNVHGQDNVVLFICMVVTSRYKI